MKDAILFDLDGTLWDSVDGCVHAWNEVLAAHPGAGEPLTPARMRSYMGKTNQQIARLMMPTLSDADAMSIMAECSAHEHDYLRTNGGGRLFDGVLDTLRALSQTYDLYIISNCESGYIEIFLDLCDVWSLFRGRACPGDTGLLKGDNIRLILKNAGNPRAFYLGDTEGDEQAARQAGIPFVHAAYGFGTAIAPNAVLHSFRDRPQLARTMFSR